jgi:hypothetical protein
VRGVPPAPAAQPPPAYVEPPPADEPPPAERQQLPAEALLRATQMAVAGSDRLEIERTLETEFAVANPRAIVDSILGPEVGSS